MLTNTIEKKKVFKDLSFCTTVGALAEEKKLCLVKMTVALILSHSYFRRLCAYICSSVIGFVPDKCYD